ncbi:hypothetical protein [Nocardia sp. NPDC050435]|uniref:hypothetical protein n=1 Tax=Nocardia sp. NPDC050435 TaxID=3155040 RepID=UPI003402B5D4
MADEDLDRLRAEITDSKLAELREDRDELLADLAGARGRDRVMLERQLQQVEDEIAAVLDRKARRGRQRPPPDQLF